MQTLELNENKTPAKRPGFLQRQFAELPTLRQAKFDWTFGVGLPIVCIAADPIVFRSWLFADPTDTTFVKYKIFCYVLSSVSIMAMAAWLLWGNKLGELRPFLGGLFLVAAAISTIVGVMIFPYSAFGIVFAGLGLLGFTPLISGFVFFRNAFRTLDSAADDLPLKYVFQAAMLAVVYALVVPFVLNF